MKSAQLRVLVLVVLLSISNAYIGVGKSCNSDSDCTGILVCSSSTNQCEKYTISTAFGSWEIWVSTIAVVFGSIVSAAAGVGGGGVYVPVFVLLLGMTPQQAVPMSSGAIFGGAIINLIYNVKAKQDITSSFKGKVNAFEGMQRPLIDFDTLLVMMPMMLAGTIVGVIMNIVQPSWLLVVELVTILGYTTVKSGKKAVKSWKAETEEKRKMTLEMVSDPSENENLDEIPVDENVERNFEELKGLLDVEMRPKTQSAQMIVLWIIIILFALIRGGKSTTSIIPNVKFCSSSYWIITAFQFILLAFFTLLLGRVIYQRSIQKMDLGWVIGKGEIYWSKSHVIAYPALSFFAGLCGGMLGIGGGMVLGPLFLELGMNNSSTSATSATSVFITASSAAVQYLIIDMLLLDFTGWYFFWCVLGTYIGQEASAYIKKKYKRTSFIAFAISGIIFLALVMMTISGAFTIKSDVENGTLGFAAFC